MLPEEKKQKLKEILESTNHVLTRKLLENVVITTIQEVFENNDSQNLKNILALLVLFKREHIDYQRFIPHPKKNFVFECARRCFRPSMVKAFIALEPKIIIDLIAQDHYGILRDYMPYLFKNYRDIVIEAIIYRLTKVDESPDSIAEAIAKCPQKSSLIRLLFEKITNINQLIPLFLLQPHLLCLHSSLAYLFEKEEFSFICRILQRHEKNQKLSERFQNIVELILEKNPELFKKIIDTSQLMPLFLLHPYLLCLNRILAFLFEREGFSFISHILQEHDTNQKLADRFLNTVELILDENPELLNRVTDTRQLMFLFLQQHHLLCRKRPLAYLLKREKFFLIYCILQEHNDDPIFFGKFIDTIKSILEKPPTLNNQIHQLGEELISQGYLCGYALKLLTHSANKQMKYYFFKHAGSSREYLFLPQKPGTHCFAYCYGQRDHIKEKTRYILPAKVTHKIG